MNQNRPRPPSREALRPPSREASPAPRSAQPSRFRKDPVVDTKTATRVRADAGKAFNRIYSDPRPEKVSSQAEKRMRPPQTTPAGAARLDRPVSALKRAAEEKKFTRMTGGNNKFGKVLRPYRRHLRKVTPKGIWFNTRFGVKKLRVNRVGMYIKASRKNFYLHKW